MHGWRAGVLGLVVLVRAECGQRVRAVCVASCDVFVCEGPDSSIHGRVRCALGWRMARAAS